MVINRTFRKRQVQMGVALAKHLGCIQDYMLYEDEIELVRCLNGLRGGKELSITDVSSRLSNTNLPYYRFLIGTGREQQGWTPFHSAESFNEFSESGSVMAFNSFNSMTDKRSLFQTRLTKWLRRTLLTSI